VECKFKPVHSFFGKEVLPIPAIPTSLHDTGAFKMTTLVISRHQPRRVTRLVISTSIIVVCGMAAGGSAFAATAPITAHNAWFRYLLPQIPAGGFVTLDNASAQPIVLTGVQTDACGMAMLHKSVTSSGVERMEMVGNVTIPAHGSFKFSPGAYHIMCMQPKMKPGQTVTVSLSFQNIRSLDVPFTVYGADGKPAAK
jgi:copper(I)-binding protein